VFKALRFRKQFPDQHGVIARQTWRSESRFIVRTWYYVGQGVQKVYYLLINSINYFTFSSHFCLSSLTFSE
jgi:hypothetical protein